MHTFEEVKERIEAAAREWEAQGNGAFDVVVAVANGGIIPAAMIVQRLGLPFEVIKVSLRGPDQVPIHAAPTLVEPLRFDPAGKRVLLVEDRVKTGASLRFAKKTLENAGADVKTLAVNGPADYSLYNEDCFRFPWLM